MKNLKQQFFYGVNAIMGILFAITALHLIIVLIGRLFFVQLIWAEATYGISLAGMFGVYFLYGLVIDPILDGIIRCQNKRLRRLEQSE